MKNGYVQNDLSTKKPLMEVITIENSQAGTIDIPFVCLDRNVFNYQL